MNNFEFVLGTALILGSIGSSVSDDFCEAFRGHQNSISYMHKQILRGTNEVPEEEKIKQTNHIIIDGKYWNIVFDRETENITFNPTESFPAKYFTDAYFEAATLWRGDQNGYGYTLLFAKDKKDKLYMTQIQDNDFLKARPLDEFEEPTEVSLEFPNKAPDWFENIVFIHEGYMDWSDTGLDVHIGSSTKSFIGKKIGINEFQAAQGKYIFVDRTSEIDRAFKNINQTRDVIGIEAQSSIKSGNLATKQSKTGYLILMKSEQKIYWCWRAYDQENCEEIELIDCTGDTPPSVQPNPDDQGPTSTENTSGGNNKEEKSSLTWLFIVIAVIIILCIIGAILFFMCGRSQSEEKPSKEGSGVRRSSSEISSINSTRSKDITTSDGSNDVKTDRSTVASKGSQSKSAAATSSAKSGTAQPSTKSSSGKK